VYRNPSRKRNLIPPAPLTSTAHQATLKAPVIFTPSAPPDILPSPPAPSAHPGPLRHLIDPAPRIPLFIPVLLAPSGRLAPTCQRCSSQIDPNSLIITIC